MTVIAQNNINDMIVEEMGQIEPNTMGEIDSTQEPSECW